MINFQKIENKWQKRWKEKEIFNPIVDKKRKKYFFTVPYPYISGSLHLGHSRVVINGDIHCRFKRMKGYNVLYPLAFHITGTPVLGISSAIKAGDKKKIKLYESYVKNYIDDSKEVKKVVESFKDPWKIVEFFTPKMVEEFSSLGLSVDWKRKFNTGQKDYQKMIEWQFKKYKNMGYISKGKYPVLYCESCENAVGEDDIKDGDSNPVDKQEFTLLKFKINENKNRYLVAATLRPETVFGQTNLWINSKEKYLIVSINNEEWVLSESAAEKLKYQKDKIKILNEIKGSELIGEYVKAPFIEKDIVVLPSEFIDMNIGTGIVTSVPSDAPYDYIALKNLKNNKKLLEKYNLDFEEIKKIEPINIIKTKEFGNNSAEKVCKKMNITKLKDSKLDEATKKVYKAGFHTGKMNKKCGKYSELGVEKAKNKIKKELLKNNLADVFFETSRIAECRCGGKILVAMLQNQWFLDFNAKGWKNRAKKCLDNIDIKPKIYRKRFEDVFEWLDKRPVARKRGIGTKLPFDKDWIIESLSDSTIYMTYYTIKNLVEKFKIKPKQMNEDFFNYVYLNKGNINEVVKNTGIKKDYLNKLKNSFEYWYPNDHRHTFINHLSNHLSFYIFAHAGIFPKKYWPKQISFHGIIFSEGEKMSKSKGNIVTILDIKNKFGADVFRAYLATATSVDGDFNWVTEEVQNMKKHINDLFKILKESTQNVEKGELTVLGKAFISKFERSVKQVTKYVEEMKHREYANIVIYDLFKEYKKLIRQVSKEEINEVNRNVIEKWIKLLSPIIPHISEELWEALGKDNFVSLEKWPISKNEKIDKKIENAKILSEQISSDVKTISELINKNPEKIEIFVSPDWKFELLNIIKNQIKNNNRNLGDIMKKALENKKLKEKSKKIPKIIKKILSHPNKMPNIITSQKEELESIKSLKQKLEKELNCNIKITPAQKSKENKSNQAMPGKPAILVKK